jgi:tetratricopeptide (TPR) repeat protein
MTADAWAQAEALFNRAVELPAAERAALLDSCSDPELRHEVESLLANAASTNTGEPHTLTAVANLAADLAEETDPDKLRVGQHFGPYRIDSIIGHGGMGAVFAATRDDDQYQKRVAIKLVRAAMVSPERLTRFRRERQILARLEHNYITRMLDGGITADGMPYLVMEHVDGLPITSYCDQGRLGLHDRLLLFRKVCEAVEYAHRNLVVHRDLKPANILVTPDGSPKLMDFGIATLLEPPTEEDGALPQTQTMTVLMTPAYASPEQVRGVPVTTASDVYSLGAVLYELLTGTKAHRLTSNTPAELVAVVCNTEVARPSAVAALEPRDRKKLRGDLDNIILKAMRKDPARRYGAVAEFSQDLERYLSDRPVLARPDSLLYRTGKYVRRNWVALLAASIAVAGVCIGGGLAVYQARIAQQRFQQVRKLANRFLFDFYGEIATVPGTTKAKEMVVSTALEYLDQLSKSAGNDTDLQLELADAYEKVGTVSGFPGDAGNLGRIRDAAAAYRKAIAIYERIGAQRDAALYGQARTSLRLGYLLRRMGSIQESAELEKKVGPIIDRLLAKDPANLTYLAQAAQYSKLRSIRERDQSNSVAALEYILKTREYRRRILQMRDTPKARSDVAIEDTEVADALFNLGQFDQARKDAESAERTLKQLLAQQPHQSDYRRALFIVYAVEGAILDDDESPSLENPAEALPKEQQALALTEESLKADPHDAQAKSDLSWALDRIRYVQRKDPDKALAAARQAVALQDELAPLGHPPGLRANIVRGLAVALLSAGKKAESEQRALEAVSIHQSQFAKDPKNRETLIFSLLVAGDALMATGKNADAGDKYQQAVRLADPLLAMPTSPARLRNAEQALLRYADYCGKTGQNDRVHDLYGRILKGWSAWDQPNPYTERKRAEALSRMGTR